MTLKPALLSWLLRSMRLDLVALPVACAWVLFARTPLFDHNVHFIPFVFAFVHGLLCTVFPLGQTRSESFAFLYTRGFSRDVLWNHKMLATLAAVLIVWLPAALLVWTGARSAAQDHWFQNPLYPLVAPREVWAPFTWLAAYGLFLPAFHYAWIRRGQPVRGAESGDSLVVALAVTVVVMWNGPNQAVWFAPWYRAMLWGAGALVSLTLLLTGRRLHRELEVLPW